VRDIYDPQLCGKAPPRQSVLMPALCRSLTSYLVTKGTQQIIMSSMKSFRWNQEKNNALMLERGISFETVVVAIESGGLLDILSHPNPLKYPNQRIFVVTADHYVYLVPYVDEDEYVFLKTVIPSRKATRDYLNRGESHAEK
jgi:uncharacterized DUF497 family protein